MELEKEFIMKTKKITIECEKCGVNVSPNNTYVDGLMFVCASCKTKSIMKLRKELL